MRMRCCLIVTCLLLSINGVVAEPPEAQPPQARPAEAPTDYAALDRFIRESTDEVEGGAGRWACKVRGVAVIVMADRAADRMRIMTPVARVADFEAGEYERLMEANYDRALDARYAINGGVLWSAFIHPMSRLGQVQFDDALAQVLRLSANFGTTYASSDLVFAPGGQQPEEQPGEGEAPGRGEDPAAPDPRGAPRAPRS